MPKRTKPQTTQNKVEETWEKIENMKTGARTDPGHSDENGFNKLNTNFFLRDGESAYVQFVDNVPFIFAGHGLKMTSKRGSTYYITEACQKSTKRSCVLCSSSNSRVSDMRQYIAFRLIDYRGTYDTKTKKVDSDVPAPSIFLTPKGLAMQLKQIIDDNGGDITDKLIKLTKNEKNYNAQVVVEKDKDDPSLQRVKKAKVWDGLVPDAKHIYSPKEDEDLLKIIGDDDEDEGSTDRNSTDPKLPF